MPLASVGHVPRQMPIQRQVCAGHASGQLQRQPDQVRPEEGVDVEQTPLPHWQLVSCEYVTVVWLPWRLSARVAKPLRVVVRPEHLRYWPEPPAGMVGGHRGGSAALRACPDWWAGGLHPSCVGQRWRQGSGLRHDRPPYLPCPSPTAGQRATGLPGTRLPSARTHAHTLADGLILVGARTARQVGGLPKLQKAGVLDGWVCGVRDPAAA